MKAHIFLCMLAYYVEWHLKQDLAPLLGEVQIYEKGKKITDGQLSAIILEQSEFHGEWNYKIKPQNLALM